MPVISGGAGGASGALTQLSATTLGANGTFDVSAISQAYSSLLITWIVRGAGTNGSDNLTVRFNNDAASGDYFSQQLVAGNAATAASAQGTSTGLLIPIVDNASVPAASFTVIEMTLFGYASTTWDKSCVVTSYRRYGAAVGNEDEILFGGMWVSQAAVNRLQALGTTVANLLAGSVMTIYGLQ